jgi:hypothetical protein
MGVEVDTEILNRNFVAKGLRYVLVVNLHKLVTEDGNDMPLAVVKSRAQTLFLHPCLLKSEFPLNYHGLTLVHGILIGDNEIH